MTETPTPEMVIVYRDPTALRPYDRNARTHPPSQIAKLRAIIREVGFRVPVLLRDDDETIGAGHGRVEAAIEEGIELIPTITLHGLTEAKWKSFVLADNRIGQDAGWNFDLVKAELFDIREAGGALDLTGFDLAEVSGLFAASKPKGDRNTVPPVPAVATTRQGDIWLLGSHRIICGDATSPEVVARLLDGETAELCLTDPPYGIGYGYKDHDDSDNEANAVLVEKVFRLAPAAKVWTPGSNNLARDINRFGRAKTLYWHKGFAAAGNGLGGASTIEPVLVVGPPKHKKLANDYLDFKTDREELAGKSLREHHPCPKPVDLFAHLAEAFCKKGGIIYEPFSGSGTTLLACTKVGRVCRAVEIDPAYVDVAVARWQAFTGETARLQETGRSFDEVVEERGEPV